MFYEYFSANILFIEIHSYIVIPLMRATKNVLFILDLLKGIKLEVLYGAK